MDARDIGAAIGARGRSRGRGRARVCPRPASTTRRVVLLNASIAVEGSPGLGDGASRRGAVLLRETTLPMKLSCPRAGSRARVRPRPRRKPDRVPTVERGDDGSCAALEATLDPCDNRPFAPTPVRCRPQRGDARPARRRAASETRTNKQGSGSNPRADASGPRGAREERSSGEGSIFRHCLLG